MPVWRPASIRRRHKRGAALLEFATVSYERESGFYGFVDHRDRLAAGDQPTERGAVLILTAFIFIALLTVAALVVDIVMIHQAELRAQATADSSVLAAALDLGDIGAATVQAKEYAARNYGVTDADWGSCVDAAPLPVATTVPCISIDDATDPTHIRVRLPDRTVPSFFASVLGRDGFSVSAASIAEIEYVIVDSDPGTGDPGDPDTPSLRDGDPGGGYPPCENLPDWDQPPPAGSKKKNWTEFIFVFEHPSGGPSNGGRNDDDLRDKQDRRLRQQCVCS